MTPKSVAVAIFAVASWHDQLLHEARDKYPREFKDIYEVERRTFARSLISARRALRELKALR